MHCTFSTSCNPLIRKRRRTTLRHSCKDCQIYPLPTMEARPTPTFEHFLSKNPSFGFGRGISSFTGVLMLLGLVAISAVIAVVCLMEGSLLGVNSPLSESHKEEESNSDQISVELRNISTTRKENSAFVLSGGFGEGGRPIEEIEIFLGTTIVLSNDTNAHGVGLCMPNIPE